MSKSRRQKDDRVVVFLSADHHAGHALALCNPAVVLSDPQGNPYTPVLRETQTYLWDDVWMWGLNETFAWADGAPVHAMILGDLGQGDKYPDEWVDRTTLDDQSAIIVANLEPLFAYRRVEAVEICIGTGAHNFGAGGLELIAARLLQSKYPKVPIHIGYHARSNIHGVLFDTAHHGPWPGAKSWLEGNVARFYLRDAMNRDFNILGNPPAHIYARAHYHYRIEERLTMMLGGQEYESWLLEVPSLTGLGDYAHKATRSMPYVINGTCAIEIVNGVARMPPRWFTKVIDVRQERSYP